MSSVSTSAPSNFNAIFDMALAQYTKHTGQDLLKHPLVAAINRCKSPDVVLAIFHRQSQAFHKSRDGDPKLIKWLAPVVNGLYAISICAVLSAGTSLVS
jgi:hypothetical protein